jgi:hypothetical protein
MRWFSLLLIICVSVGSYGQKLSKYYTSRLQPQGTLYFIYPIEGFKSAKDKSTFTFDITYRTESDTATINFSYYVDSVQPADSIYFLLATDTLKSSVVKIFTDWEKKRWHHRYYTNFTFQEIAAIFHSSTIPTIRVVSPAGYTDHRITKRKWQKYSKALTKIMISIGVNK